MNDAERLSQDPTFRLIGSEKNLGARSRVDFPAAIVRDRTTDCKMRTWLDWHAINRDLIGRAEAMDSPQRVVLDMDSTEIPVYGQQEQSAYNGHFESMLLSPVVAVQSRG